MSISKTDIIDAINSIKFRFEKQPTEIADLESFVPIVDFNNLSASNTQIIYGRNGTGKTHLLKAFCRYCKNNYTKNKILPVYIDFKELQLGPVLPEIEVHDLIIRFYKLFIRKIIEHLKVFSDEVITVSLLDKIFKGDNQKKKNEISINFDKLESLINLSEIEELTQEYVREIEVGKEGSSKISGQTILSGSVSLIKQKAEMSSKIDLSAEELEKQKETLSIVYKGLAVLDYNQIRSELENVIEKCGARTIIILIDEWSSVNLSIQPLLAEMIQKTIGISNKIFLKIVALKFFTNTSLAIDSSQRIGLQIGIDLSQLVDLDQLLNMTANEQAMKDFLTLVAFNHICLEIPRLKTVRIDKFESFLCSQIFENDNAYHEIIRASEGNPRDFLSILSNCCSILTFRRKSKINEKDSIKVAMNFFTENKTPEIQNSQEANLLFTQIFQRVVQNKQKLFLVSSNGSIIDDRLRELWHYRFVHIVSENYTVLDKNGMPNEYKVYSMDYGKLLSLKIDAKGEKVVKIMNNAAMIISEIAADRMTGILVEILLGIVQTPLKKFSGKFLVSLEGEGVETASLNSPEYLIQHCVLDDLL